MSLSPEEPETRRKTMRRRVMAFVLMAGLLGVLFFASRSRPVEVNVRYDLSAFPRHALRTLDVVWGDGDGQEVLRASFNYHSATAPELQLQPISLPPGEYVIEATLHFSDRPRHKTESRVELDHQDTLDVVLE